MKLQFLLTVSVAGLLITLVAPVALAGAVQQTVTCEQDYIVQADDWLSKLAGKFYGDIFAYPAIVAATNAAATVDDSYTAITNPDLIEVGQKLCIPSTEAVAAGELLSGELGQTEPSLVWVDGVQAEVTDSGQLAVTVQANYPDSCSTLGEVETMVEGNTVTVTMYAQRPPGLTCAQTLIPFEETVVLDIGDVAPGEYTITVNEAAMTTVTIPEAGDPAENEDTTFNFQFETGDEGWATGFADLPADSDPEFYELEADHRELPSGLEGYGIYIQGHNHSDDLFMFLKKQVEGLQPNTTYQVTFKVDIATNVPEGMMGIGGSPGESVYVKAGASTIEPLVEEDSTGWLRMNIGKGNQANGGEDMIVIGNVASPDSTGDGEFVLKTLDSAGIAFEATTDNEGKLWLIAGSDSGFEGLTQLYYSEISASLE